MTGPRVSSAEFVSSAADPTGYPREGLPEAAFAGRSNVGKSSAMNSLLNRNNLVKTSSTPGKTRLINFFRINKGFMFTDLPGYGYAQVPEAVRRSWQAMIESYLVLRKELKVVVVLIDSRRLLMEQDEMLISFLDHHHIPRLLAFTKSDKLKSNELAGLKRKVAKDHNLAPGDFLIFSAETGAGKNELWRAIMDKMGV